MFIIEFVNVLEATENIPEDASAFYIQIPESFLSKPYELMSGDLIRGRTNYVKKEQEIPDLRDIPITFILQKRQFYDYLYISKDDWIKLFREWGLVTPSYSIGLRLFEAVRIQAKETIGLYTKKDFKY